MGAATDAYDETTVRVIDHVRGEINEDFRSASEIAERLGLSVYAVGAPLGMLRRHGEVEFMRGPRGEGLWRKASRGDLQGPRSGERGGERRKVRR
jgi:hypothetical protein